MFEALRERKLILEKLLDDARHTMVIARTAAEYGAVVASSTRVTAFSDLVATLG